MAHREWMTRSLFLLPFLFAATLSAAEPVRLIFDTDITGDVDDVLALAMCHTLADRGACELIGVTISKDNPRTASFVDAQNTWYGRPDLPVGVTRDPQAQKRESKYLGLADSPDYPHDLRDNNSAREAVELLRELLATSPDGSVTIVSVGIASNLANLLKSASDAHSPLDGPALIRRKVKRLSIMAGAFTFANGTNYHLEANVINGIGYMQTVAEQWPEEVPVIWSGYEIGENLPFPRKSVAEDFGYREKHLVREAYLLHSGPEHDRPCWDQSSVLEAVFPDRGYFGLSAPGRVSVGDDGFTRFRPAGKDGKGSKRDRFLTMIPVQQARALEAIVQLTVQPPR
jgi:purine nucleosidase